MGQAAISVDAENRDWMGFWDRDSHVVATGPSIG
jgi:hypothetical protein